MPSIILRLLCCGTGKQSFASDIYSAGRVLHTEGQYENRHFYTDLSSLCLSLNADDRPTASELNTFLSNLFEQ